MAIGVMVGGVLALSIIAMLTPVEGPAIMGDSVTLVGLAPAGLSRGVGSLGIAPVAIPGSTPVPVVGPGGASIGSKASFIVLIPVVVATPVALLAIGVVAIGLGLLLGAGAGPVARLATDVTVAW